MQATPRKRDATPSKPEGVTAQVWSDWLQLRKAKRAPVTQTVIDMAAKEASKAALSLDAFLSIWCARGSQGLEAGWIKPAERSRYAPIKADDRNDHAATLLGFDAHDTIEG